MGNMNSIAFGFLQDLIDKARATLVGNRNLVQRMEASLGISPNSDSDDSAFANFNLVNLFVLLHFISVYLKSNSYQLSIIFDDRIAF